MRILQIHNVYQQPGGEDLVVANEEALLSRRGHQVWQYQLHNDLIPLLPQVQVALKTIWNADAYGAVRQRVRKFGIDVVHTHNTFPLTSPAVYYAARAEKIPVVQTLHNYRLLCPAATLFRSGQVCQKCMGSTFSWPSIVHHCYRGSAAATGVSAAMLAAHRIADTYSRTVSAYIAPSRFALETFVQGGLPRHLIRLKSNFVLDDPGIGSGYGGYALYLGRLAPEKGVETLLKAWSSISIPIHLKIAGDGPLRNLVTAAAETNPRIEYLGQCSRPRVNDLLRGAALLVFPSEWFEVSPLSVIEAMACGTPILAANHGSLSEMIVAGENGLLFPVADVATLVETLERLFLNPDTLNSMRYSTRRHFEAHYTSGANYDKLLDIYQSVAAKGAD